MSVCPSQFVLSGYVSPDDGGANMIYRLTQNNDGGPLSGVSGGTATPCGTWVPQSGIIGAHCSVGVCGDTKTLLRQFKSDALPLSSWGGYASLAINCIAINPWNTWYRQSFTADFVVMRGGAAVYSSGPFTQLAPDFSGTLLYLTSLDTIYFTPQPGDAILLSIYVVLSYRGCRSDDGLRPNLSHGGGGAGGDARGVLRIPNIVAPGSQSLALYPALACQAWPVVKREVWATHVAAGPGGVEVRQGTWTAPLLEWELTYDVLRTGTVNGTAYAEMEQLLGFFGARRAQFDAFLYDDVTDNTATNEPIGTGDGVTTSFALTRTLGGSVAPIGRPNAIVTVTVGGVATTAFTPTGNVITFTTPPANGAAVVWSGTYYWLARFADAELTLENFANQLWASRSVKLRQVRV